MVIKNIITDTYFLYLLYKRLLGWMAMCLSQNLYNMILLSMEQHTNVRFISGGGGGQCGQWGQRCFTPLTIALM